MQTSRSIHRMFVLAAVSLIALSVAATTHAVTFNQPVQEGDLVATTTNLDRLIQIRGNAVISDINFGAADAVGGVFSTQGNVFIANNTAGARSIDFIAHGETMSTSIIGNAQLTGTGNIRDIAVAFDGTVYVSYAGGNGTVQKFTPDGIGGFNAAINLGTFGITTSDRGSDHLTLSLDGKYLLTAARNGAFDLASMDTTTGAAQGFLIPGAGLGIGQMALDPITGNRIVYGVTNDVGGFELFETDFNTVTGAIGAGGETPLADFGANLVDSIAIDPVTGDLYFTIRSSKLETGSYALLTAARLGTTFTEGSLTIQLTNGAVNITRDLALVGAVPVPEPATALLLFGAVGLLARRRSDNRKRGESSADAVRISA
ncbi:MAG: PEP-CTERM sorting domain-containing protein [Phycisphaeraceae bacterium]